MVDDPQIGVDVFTGSPTEVTVTNAFPEIGPEVVISDPPVSPPVAASAAAAPAAVVATPTFTG